MKLICVEGSIGSGKSTLTNQLAELMNARPMYEPVDDNPYLEKFYTNPKRYALDMQFWLMSKRFEMHETAIRHIWRTGQSVVMDRSIYGDWVFAKANWLDGNIDDAGYESYLKHRKVMDKYLLTPHVVVWLNAAPNVCKERIGKRGRDCEKFVSYGYLEGLHLLYREFVLEMRDRGSRIISLNYDQYEDAAAVVGLINKIDRVNS